MDAANADFAPPPVVKPRLSPGEAWQPLPAGEWNEDAARHLLRRTGWSARPDEVGRALADGLAPTLERLFPVPPTSMVQPALIGELEDDTPAFTEKIRAASGDEKRRLRREARERSRTALQDMNLRWLQLASLPEHAAFEKWVLFLSDVYVVAFQKVYHAGLIWKHYDLLRQHAYGPAPVLAKAVSRSPAMVMYLDLQQSRRDAPNENFAREFFELFSLGVGNYTERDIKQSARAFTGYRQRFGEFAFVRREHDDGLKTVFGQTGDFTGDDIIDLAYQQPAAGRFIPHEMVKWYLSDTPLDDEYLATIGRWWSGQNHDLRQLALNFFGSRLFFAPEFRGNFIKSPVQFYLSMMGDLNLDVAPLPRATLIPLRQMGQELFNPPNVRGWVGGRYWINSATLSARRALVATLFNPPDERRLNADEQNALAGARAAGFTRFAFTGEPLEKLAQSDTGRLTARFCDYFLPVKVDAGFRADVDDFLRGDGTEPHRLDRVRTAAMSILESPEYQLC